MARITENEQIFDDTFIERAHAALGPTHERVGIKEETQERWHLFNATLIFYSCSSSSSAAAATATAVVLCPSIRLSRRAVVRPLVITIVIPLIFQRLL